MIDQYGIVRLSACKKFDTEKLPQYCTCQEGPSSIAENHEHVMKFVAVKPYTIRVAKGFGSLLASQGYFMQLLNALLKAPPIKGSWLENDIR